MKQIIFLSTLLIALMFFACDGPIPIPEPEPCAMEQPCDFFYEVVLDSVMTDHTAIKPVDLSGFREFAVMARFEGDPNANFAFEIGFDRTTIVREEIVLNGAGWLNFAKTYPVYTPNVGLAIYHAPAGTKVRMTFYAGK